MSNVIIDKLRKIDLTVVAGLMVCVPCFVLLVHVVVPGAEEESTVSFDEVVRVGLAEKLEDGTIRWIQPKVEILQIEKQVIVKVPEVKIIEVAVPQTITMGEFKRALIEDRHEQALKAAELNEFFGEEAKPVGKVAEEEVIDKVQEKKQSFFGRLFGRKKEQK